MKQGFRRRYRERNHGLNPSIMNITSARKEDIEDILRILGESNIESIPIGDVFEKYNKCSKQFGIILKKMETDGMIIIHDGNITCTEYGLSLAREIAEKHVAIEKAFNKSGVNLSVHKIAHILEHQLDQDDISKIYNFKVDPNQSTIPLSEFPFPAGTIYKLNFDSEKLLYKMLSLGFYPGQYIEILNKSEVNLVVRVKDCRIGLNKHISKNIMMIP